jgi:hypothetical protein
MPQKQAVASTASPVPVDPPLWGQIQVNAKQRLDANAPASHRGEGMKVLFQPSYSSRSASDRHSAVQKIRQRSGDLSFLRCGAL